MKSITKLQVKDFARWLRKQARLFGRGISVGYIGDHIDNPLESYLQELTGKFVSGTSCDGYDIGSKHCYLSNEMEGFSICTIEGDTDEMPECGYAEITAWEMLAALNSHLGSSMDAYLFAQHKDS